MRLPKNDDLCKTDQAFDVISAVKELHLLSSQELNKLIRESENSIIHRTSDNGSSVQIDVEKLARYLPLHLIAMLMSSERDEGSLKYLLCGCRLLHSLCDVASRHPKLEQILLDDVRVSEQLLDLAIYLLIVLGGYRQEHQTSNPVVLLHSALVASSLYLLTGCISSQWQDLAQVLLVHPKVDIFMEVAFAAVRVDIKLLQIKLSVQCVDSYPDSSPEEGTLDLLCQQCEASLQFLQSLCQQKMFRERLVKNKELCGKGGFILLAQLIMNLNISPSFKESSADAAISRLKSKVLSILLQLCEAETISYLDEVASTPESLELAQSVALEILELLKTKFRSDLTKLSASSQKTYPRGLLQLNAMRLADIFSDDSNFRSFITAYFTEILNAIFSLPHGEFLLCWCSSELKNSEEDAALEYDPLKATGWVLDIFSSSDLLISRKSESTFVPGNMPRASYAHQRTSLLVKVIANLHCFAPDIIKDDKDLFLNKFLQCLQSGLPNLSNEISPTYDADKSVLVSKNLRSLLSHAQSLIPNFLNEDDVQLLRVFVSDLESHIAPREPEINAPVQEREFERSVAREQLSEPNIGENPQEVETEIIGFSAPVNSIISSDFNNRSGNLKEGVSAFQEGENFHVRGNNTDQTDMEMQDKRRDLRKPGGDVATGLRESDRDILIIDSSGSDSSSSRGKNVLHQKDYVDFPKSGEHVKGSTHVGFQGDGKVETIQHEEKQRRKRKRTIMNDNQVDLIEKALLGEPHMQRHASSLQSWADKLSKHGSEVTASQLKNWLNNRKARLARVTKDFRAPSEEHNTFLDKQIGLGAAPLYDSPGSPLDNADVPSAHTSRVGTGENSGTAQEKLVNFAPTKSVECEPGQYVMLVDDQGEEIGKGKVHQAKGKWNGRKLEQTKTYVVDILELTKADRWGSIPYPCPATGTSFDQAEKMQGVMRIIWDSDKCRLL